MNILHVICSPRGKASESRRLSQSIVGLLREGDPAATVIERIIGDGAIPPVDTDYALSQQASEDVSTDGSAALSAELIGEVRAADVLVIGTPMHNYTVPATLKLWIDHIARVRYTFDVSPQGKIALLRDRPVFIAISSGGRFSGLRSRQPDFLTPYLKAILGMIGLRDLIFFSVEGTGLGPDVVAASRIAADQALRDYFSRSRAVAPLSAPVRTE